MRFQDFHPDLFAIAGGKGGNLARMFQRGFPVPEGFVVLPGSFQNEKLIPKAWEEIRENLNRIRKYFPGSLFAVRSSALSEDSSKASFAGEYETVLNVKSDEEVFRALHTVHGSRLSHRVSVYGSVHGITHYQEMSIVIQRMVPSEIAGVLFTADPITGSHAKIIGNYVHGPGEKLVSGESNAESFDFTIPKGKYNGPGELKKYSHKLFRYAKQIQAEWDSPQDIEWALSRGKVYVLQTRPITNLHVENLDTYEMNYSLNGDFLWTNANLIEAVPDAISPFNWSYFKYIEEFTGFFPKQYATVGNICGRLYLNHSILSSLFALFGMSLHTFSKIMEEAFGKIPDEISIPFYPLLTMSIFFTQVLPGMIRRNRNFKEAEKKQNSFLNDNAEWCAKIQEAIQCVKTSEELLNLWKNGIDDQVVLSHMINLAAGNKAAFTIKLRKKLMKITRAEEYLILLYQEQADSQLASLGLIIGIYDIMGGKLDEKEYMKKYGHRGPHEAELMLPSIAEDPDWLAKQIDDYKKSNSDIQTLFENKQTQIQKTWEKFQQHFPRKVTWLKKQVDLASAYSCLREDARSEHIRSYRVLRNIALKAGEITGIGEDVFFLYRLELIRLLEGDRSMLKNIPARKINYQRYSSYPPFPSIIRGRFDPEVWMKDPDRRSDYHDPSISNIKPDYKILKGFAGASGRIKGTVRVLGSPEEGNELQPGEILVATTTNIGWTLFFTKAAAIITEIGAPFSHAAIVARELGIPAVVGCGNATSILQSGIR